MLLKSQLLLELSRTYTYPFTSIMRGQLLHSNSVFAEAQLRTGPSHVPHRYTPYASNQLLSSLTTTNVSQMIYALGFEILFAGLILFRSTVCSC
jgi:hypothetical protein